MLTQLERGKLSLDGQMMLHHSVSPETPPRNFNSISTSKEKSLPPRIEISDYSNSEVELASFPASSRPFTKPESPGYLAMNINE